MHGPSGDQGHRKTIRHFEVHRQARLLTFSCYQRMPLLLDARRCAVVAESLHRAVKGHGFLLAAFVFMPEHVHAVVVPWNGGATVPPLLSAIKRPASFRIKQLLKQEADPLLERLTVIERPGKRSFRFWQEGPGHDRNLDGPEALARAIGYIHDNPVERGLCTSKEEWTWSSYRQYADLEVGPGVPRVTRWCWGMGYELDKNWPKLGPKTRE